MLGQSRPEPDSIDTSSYPRVFFDWAELEGPLYDQWPPRSTEALFTRGLEDRSQWNIDYAREIFALLLPRAFREEEQLTHLRRIERKVLLEPVGVAEEHHDRPRRARLEPDRFRVPGVVPPVTGIVDPQAHGEGYLAGVPDDHLDASVVREIPGLFALRQDSHSGIPVSPRREDDLEPARPGRAHLDALVARLVSGKGDRSRFGGGETGCPDGSPDREEHGCCGREERASLERIHRNDCPTPDAGAKPTFSASAATRPSSDPTRDPPECGECRRLSKLSRENPANEDCAVFVERI